MKIDQIIAKVDEKQIFVPAFQREYVWKKVNAKELISSLIQDYPTGTLLTWETKNPPEIKGDFEYNESQGAVKLILDGQQRVTTLYMLLTGKIPPYYKEEEILHDPRNLYVNVKSLELEYYKKTRMKTDPLWVKLTDIFLNKVEYRDVVDQLEDQADGERVSRETERVIYDNFRAIEKIKERDFLEQEVPVHASVKEAIDIFYIVNASGVNLTDAELALAQISGYWPEARDRFKKKLNELEKFGFVFKLDFIVYVLLGITHQVGSKMEKLHTPDNYNKIKEVWGVLESDVLDYVVNIMKTHGYVDHTKEINSVYALVPIIVYIYCKHPQKLTQKEIDKIIKWFYYSQVRARYISQLPQKLDKDIQIVANEENPFDKLLGIIESQRPLKITKDEFIGVGISHPLWGLMRWYFKSKNAVCLNTGVGLRRNMGKKYDLEWDHIFAYSVLKKNGYGWENRHNYRLAQEITNRAVLTQIANRSKSNKPADGYLANVKEQLPEALALQAIPENPELWRIENYERFLEERRKMLADELNQFLEGITDTENSETIVDPSELIEEGETHHVEFKTTLRYDLREGKVNKTLEHVVLKTIAAFSNAEGGILMMGVTDDMEVVGLENDYNTLKKADKDGFELHLRNLINNSFGADFAAYYVKISFPIIDEMEICMVEIKASSAPVFLKTKDKSGQEQKKFYVRSGNSSPELNNEETSSYIQKRFNS